jgi:protein required for attachment to host cells
MPMKPERTLVVVFDSARARFFERHHNGHLEEKKTETNANLHHHSSDIDSDKPGRAFSSSGAGRSAHEPEHDPKKMEKHNFVREIAKQLDEACERHEFDRLVIVAPGRSVGEFRTLVSEKVRAKIWHEIPKEFAQLSGHDLEARLAPLLTLA